MTLLFLALISVAIAAQLSIVTNEHGHVCVSGMRARVCTLHGDMMVRSVDGAVNAANEHLAHGGGIAYAFVRFGGQVVQQESDAHVKKFGALPVAHTAVTGAGRLPAKHIIHVVGPVYDGSSVRNDLLRRATLNVLRTARRMCLQSVAIPLVSSGIFGFPKDLAARIIVDAVFEFYKHPGDTTQPDESPQGRLPPIEPCDLAEAVPFQVELLDQDVESAAAFETALRKLVERANNSEL